MTRVEENAADALQLTAEQISWLDRLPAAASAHHTEAQIQMIER